MFSKIHKNAKLNGFNVSYDLTSYPAGTYSDTKASKEGQVPLKIVRGSLDTLDNIPQAVLDNAPYDSIMTSFSLCTAKDPESSLKNIFKLLKPGGTYHFIDHVRHPKQGDPFVVEGSGVNAWIWGKIQDWLTPLWKVIAHGCHLNRRTGETIVSMRCWKDTECKTIRRSGDLVALIMPLTMGKAVKPDDSE
ncbi:hypothetical protein GGI07_004990 [Coemansia sp. Benny D115]|nr:hypothetical protein GGI07_004990 [Coemansia sp. Benny D115]